MATAKPDLSNGIWGSDDVNITDPGAAKTTEGWGSEIPPSGVQNWYQERSDEMLFHINEQGVPEWDNVTDYPVDAYAKGSDGKLYKSLQTPNVNQDPTSTPAYWEEFKQGGGFGDDENTQAGDYPLVVGDYDSDTVVVYTGTGGNTFTHIDSTSINATDAVHIEHGGIGILNIDFANVSDTLGATALGRNTLAMSPGEKIRFVLTERTNIWNAS